MVQIISHLFFQISFLLSFLIKSCHLSFVKKWLVYCKQMISLYYGIAVYLSPDFSWATVGRPLEASTSGRYSMHFTIEQADNDDLAAIIYCNTKLHSITHHLHTNYMLVTPTYTNYTSLTHQLITPHLHSLLHKRFS